MTPLTEIKPKSAKMKKGRKDVDDASRPGQKLFHLIVKGLKDELTKEKPVEEHIFSFDGIENLARVICRPTFTL